MTKKRYHELGYHNHRPLGILFIALVFTGLMLPLISAYGWVDLRSGASQVLEWTKDFATPIFEALIGDYSGGEFFFAKSLLLILIFILVFVVLEKSKFLNLDTNRTALFIISLIVSILAIRFIPETDVIKTILLPYSVLGITITTIFPLMIFAFFIHKSEIGTTGRRICWIIYLVIYGVLWYNRSDELSPIGNQIYGWIAVAAVALLIFDKQIHSYLGLSELKQAYRESDLARAAHLIREAEGLEELGTEEARRAAKRKREEAERILGG